MLPDRGMTDAAHRSRSADPTTPGPRPALYSVEDHLRCHEDRHPRDLRGSGAGGSRNGHRGLR